MLILIITIPSTLLGLVVLILIFFRGTIHINTSKEYFYNITIGYQSNIHESIYFFGVDKIWKDEEGIYINGIQLFNLFMHPTFWKRYRFRHRIFRS